MRSNTHAFRFNFSYASLNCFMGDHNKCVYGVTAHNVICGLQVSNPDAVGCKELLLNFSFLLYGLVLFGVKFEFHNCCDRVGLVISLESPIFRLIESNTKNLFKL